MLDILGLLTMYYISFYLILHFTHVSLFVLLALIFPQLYPPTLPLNFISVIIFLYKQIFLIFLFIFKDHISGIQMQHFRQSFRIYQLVFLLLFFLCQGSFSICLSSPFMLKVFLKYLVSIDVFVHMEE